MELWIQVAAILFIVVLLLILDFFITYASGQIFESAKKGEKVTNDLLKQTNTAVNEIKQINREIVRVFSQVNRAVEQFEQYVDSTICGYCKNLPIPPIGQWSIQNGVCDYLLRTGHILRCS